MKPMKAEVKNRMQAYIDQHKLLQNNDKVILAVSGGVDSVAMCHLFSQTNYNCLIAHCNFNLRGKASDEDEEFVKQLAAQYDMPFMSTSFDTEKFSREAGISIQMAARELRYQWFEKIRKEKGFYFIATAHHKNDNVETVLLNLSKGTGIKGLHGILPKQGKIIRPLLCLSKEDIINCVKLEKLTFREDKSNKKTIYQRNLIRHDVVTTLEKINPQFIDTFSRNIDKFREIEHIYLHGLSRLQKRLTEKRGDDVYISIKKLISIEGFPTVLSEILFKYEFNEKQIIQILDTLTTTSSGVQFYTRNFRLIIDRQFLIITNIESEQAGIVLVETIKKPAKLGQYTLRFHLKTNTDKLHLKKDNNHAYLDYDKLDFPLTIRNWKQGDYFYPLGMFKKQSKKPMKKKLSNYFVDNKFSLLAKEKVRILTSNNKIVWIIGHRIDDRFKITTNTKNVLEIKLKQVSKK